jgi:hypothetical protein
MPATPDAWNTLLADIANALSLCVLRDGQSTVNGNINMGGFKITNLGAPTVDSDGARKDYVDNAIAAITPVPVPVPVGAIMPYILPTAPTGWVFLRGKTLGDGLSGATERANDDCERLFKALWGAQSSSGVYMFAVHPSRGGSADADWTANRTIDMPDLRGVAPVGMDNMGGGAARNLIPSLTTLGGMVGEATHVLSGAEMPLHNHNTDGNSLYANEGTSYVSPVSAGGPYIGYGVTATTNTGGNGAHNNVQPTIGVNYITPL